MRTAVLVTGVSGGIGQALKAAFEQAGDEVIGLDCRPSPSPLRHFVEADLDRFCRDGSARAQVIAAVERAAAGANLRAIVNNAATQVVRPFGELTAEDWVRTLNVNVLAAALLAQAFRKPLEAAHGCVINIASIHARLTKPGFAAYATSKAALVGLTRSLAIELGARIRVNAICPAAIDTPMLHEGLHARPGAAEKLGASHPVGRIGTPDEVASLAVFLASDQARFVNGAALELDGGIGGRLHEQA